MKHIESQKCIADMRDLVQAGAAAVFRSSVSLLRFLRGTVGRYRGGFHPSFLACGECGGSGRVVWGFGALSHTCRRCKPYWLQGVIIDNRYFQVIPDALRDDPEIVLAAINGIPRPSKLIIDTMMSSTELFAHPEDRAGLRFASDRLKADPGIVQAAVRQQGLALQFAPDSLRDDIVVVLEAVAEDGLSLRYASQRLCDLAEIVSAAASQNHDAVRYASPRLQEWFVDDATLAVTCVASPADAQGIVSLTCTDMAGDELSKVQLETGQSVAALRTALASIFDIPSASLRILSSAVVVPDSAPVDILSTGSP